MVDDDKIKRSVSILSGISSCPVPESGALLSAYASSSNVSR